MAVCRQQGAIPPALPTEPRRLGLGVCVCVLTRGQREAGVRGCGGSRVQRRPALPCPALFYVVCPTGGVLPPCALCCRALRLPRVRASYAACAAPVLHLGGLPLLLGAGACPTSNLVELCTRCVVRPHRLVQQSFMERPSHVICRCRGLVYASVPCVRLVPSHPPPPPYPPHLPVWCARHLTLLPCGLMRPGPTCVSCCSAYSRTQSVLGRAASRQPTASSCRGHSPLAFEQLSVVLP